MPCLLPPCCWPRAVPVRWLNRLPDKLPLQPPRLPTSGSKVWELNLDLAGNTVRCGDRSFPLPAKPWWAQIVRLFLDGSVTECFVCGTEALTSRVYGLKPGETELEVTVAGDGFIELDLWPLAAISPDRLTT